MERLLMSLRFGTMKAAMDFLRVEWKDIKDGCRHPDELSLFLARAWAKHREAAKRPINTDIEIEFPPNGDVIITAEDRPKAKVKDIIR